MTEQPGGIDKKAVYHDTELLLKQYRRSRWRLNDNIKKLKISLNESINDMMELRQLMERQGYTTTKREGEILDLYESCEATQRIITVVNVAMQSLQEDPDHGEESYWILHYSYIDAKKRNTDTIIEYLEKEHDIILSRSWYFIIKRKAVEALSNILWGYMTQETIKILEKYLSIAAF